MTQDQKSYRKNWAENITYSTTNLLEPETIPELQHLVKTIQRLRPLGSTHSFNTIADSTFNQVSLRALNRVIWLNRDTATVKIEGGITYGQLAPYLHAEGFALHNLASLPHISVAGACSTATHGSGFHNGNLSTAVVSMEIVTANGDLLYLSREEDEETFLAAVVGLGAFGVVATLTLQLEPAFTMEQRLYENLSFNRFGKEMDAIFRSAYSVSLFTDYQQHRFTQAWVKRKSDEGKHLTSDFFGATPASSELHPVAGMSAINCTLQLGVPGPWFERLAHFKMDFTPSIGNELQTEYFVPRSMGYEALLAIEKYKDRITPLLLIAEIRTIAADDLWMSPCYGKPCIAFHFTWKPEWEAVKALLPLIEAELTTFKAIPHWGKLHTMIPGVIKTLYPKFSAFKDKMLQLDPEGKFRNDYIDMYIGEDGWL